MDLTPREIQDKQFHDAFRGYAHEEVDAFLDQVAAAFEKVYRDNQNLHHRLREIEDQYSQARTTEDMLKRTLLTAQRTADDAIEEARQKAQQMVEAAQAKARELEEAGAAKAQQITRDAVAQEREIQFRLEGLKHFEREYKARLRAFIESQLRVLEEGPAQPDQMDDLSPQVIEPGQRFEYEEQDVQNLDAGPASAQEEATEELPPGSEEADFAPRPAHVGAPVGTHEAAQEHMSPTVSFSPSLSPQQPTEGEDERPPPPSAEEERSIKELFWGEED